MSIPCDLLVSHEIEQFLEKRVMERRKEEGRFPEILRPEGRVHENGPKDVLPSGTVTFFWILGRKTLAFRVDLVIPSLMALYLRIEVPRRVCATGEGIVSFSAEVRILLDLTEYMKSVHALNF